MHVGFSLLTLFPGRVGGSETVVRGLLGAFAAGDGPERLTVLANRHVAAAYDDVARGPVALHHVRSYRPGDSMPTRALAMAVARALPARAARDVPEGIDVMHYPVTVPIPETGAPRVVTVHDVQHHDLPGMFSRSERAYRRWAYDGAARRADLVVVPSEHARGALARHVGVEPGRVAVIPHGVDHERFTVDGPAAPEVAALDLPERFVVYPANLWPHKNHEALIEAMALTADRDVVLVLTGHHAAPRRAELEALAERRGVAARVGHLGFVPAAAVPEVYRRALGMVFPSLYEGFGSPVLEAMACGCPVAASTAGSLPEVCGEAALMFDPTDPHAIAAAVDRLAGDDDLRERLRGLGIARAEQFTWSACARAHVATYERAGR